MQIMSHTLKKILPLLALAALGLIAFFYGLHETAGFASLKAHKDTLRAITGAHPVLAAVSFMGIYALCVALSLPIATILTLLGGFLFGLWLGTLMVVTAATLGATALFLVARSAVGARLRDKAGTAYQKVADDMRANAASYLLFLRLMPLFPFWLVNIIPALFNVKLRIFVITTLVGILPGSFVYVNVGRELGQLQGLDDILSPRMVLAFALLGMMALVPALYKRFRPRRERKTL